MPPLHLNSMENAGDVIKVCCLLHNLRLRHRLSKKIVVNTADQIRNPFRADCPKNGVVPRVRLHEDSWKTPGGTLEEKAKEEENLLRKCEFLKQKVISATLFDYGNRRQKSTKKRPAAY